MSRRGRVGRIFKRCAFVIVGVCVLYLVGVNAVLATPILRNLLNSDPGALRVNYTKSYSLYPFHGHVDGLTIRGRDRNVEWIATIDHCDFSVSPWQLLKRRFQATHVTADGFTMHARFRKSAAANTPERLAALPPVDGFSDPPLEDPTPAPPPVSDKDYNLWAVQLSDVDVDHVREVWVDEFRYSGDGRVRGSWLFRPVRQLQIGPATADLRGIDVGYGKRVVVAGVRGTVHATVHTWDVRDKASILKHVSTDTDLRGVLPNFENIVIALHVPDVEHVRGSGPLDVRLLVDHGVLLPGTHVVSVSDDTALDTHGASFHSKLRVAVDVADTASGEKPPGPVAHLRVEASDLSVSARLGHEDARAHLASAAVTVNSRQRDITESFRESTVAAEAHGFVMDNVAPLGVLLAGEGVELMSGSATADAHAEGSLADHRARGELTFHLHRLAAKREGDRIVTDAEGVVRVPDASLDEGSIDLTGSEVTLRDASGEAHGIALHVVDVHARAERARVSRAGSPDVEVDVAMHDLSTPDLRSVGALLPPSRAFAITGGRASATGHAHVSARGHALSGAASVTLDHAAARVKSVLLASSRVNGNVTLRKWSWESGHVDLSGSDVVLHDLRARSTRDGAGPTVVGTLTVHAPRLMVADGAPSGNVIADLPHAIVADLKGLDEVVPLPKGLIVDEGHGSGRAHLEIDVASKAATGKVDLRLEATRVHVGKQSIMGDLTATIGARADRLDRAIDVSGSTVLLSNVASKGEGQAVEGWSARFDFSDAALTVEPVSFRSHIHAKARDAIPVAALLGARTAVPKWAEPTMRMTGLQCDAYVRGADELIDLRSFVAKGDEDVLVRLGLAVRDQVSAGAVVVHVGKTSAAFNLDTGATNVILFGADAWFAEHDAALEARFPRRK
jgi:hypothetical protein